MSRYERIHKMLIGMVDKMSQEDFILLTTIILNYGYGNSDNEFLSTFKEIFEAHYPDQHKAFMACEKAGLGFPIS